MSLRTSLKRLAERATGTDRLREQREAIAEKLAAATAEPEKAKPNRYATPYLALMRADGVLPFPAIQPQMYLALDHAIPLEASLLLEAAHAEFGRRCASEHRNRSVEDLSATAARLYRELRIGELTAIAEQPYGQLLDQAVDDIALADAVPNIVRLDAEIDASLRRGEASGPTGSELTAAHAALEAQRDALIARLQSQPAEGMLGLRAKAQALRLVTIQEHDETATDIAATLAADVLRLTAGRNGWRLGSQARPDPVLAAVATAQEAEAAADAFDASPPQLPRPDQWRLQSDALSEKFFAAREAVWKTRPTTAEGWQALIAYARSQVLKGIDENDDLLGYGPLLTVVFGALSAAASTNGQGA